MLSLDKRINLAKELGIYMLSGSPEWLAAQQAAVSANAWFTPQHVSLAIYNIANEFLEKGLLNAWVAEYKMPATPKKVGIVMAGNIPLVGFHDFLCGFIAGHDLHIKLSSKDAVLLPHLVNKLIEWELSVKDSVHFSDMLKNCDAYIATGSNNTARYFEQYFAKYPHIIRKNRTSVAVLNGEETGEELTLLADDVFTYFGLGCRNITQVCVPVGYDFTALLHAFGKYEHFANHNKYKNNYDYYLAIYLLNKVPYITNGAVLLVENHLPFSAVSVVHYKFYENEKALIHSLRESEEVQAIIGQGLTPFGQSQKPALNDYADGVDTMAFLCGL